MLSLLGIIGLACCLAAAHPFTTYPISLWLLLRLRGPVAPAPVALQPTRHKVAICMCAYNEEAVIETRLDTLLATAHLHGDATIHVFADAPSDRTADILRRYADKIDLVISADRCGKTYGMNQLVARSVGDVLVFTDANVVHSKDVLAKLLAPFADPGIGCTSARLNYTNAGESATAAAGAAYWSNEERIKRLESETYGLIGIDGALFAMRRALHRPPPLDLIDDLYLSLTVTLSRSRAVSVPGAVVFERSAVRASEEKNRKRRIACQAINVHRALWPELRRLRLPLLYCYLSHRLLKWMTPLLAMAAIIAFFALAALVVGLGDALLVATAVTAVLAIGYRLEIAPFRFIGSAVLSLYGVGAGMVDAGLLGKTYTVWDPAKSVRG